MKSNEIKERIKKFFKNINPGWLYCAGMFGLIILVFGLCFLDGTIRIDKNNTSNKADTIQYEDKYLIELDSWIDDTETYKIVYTKDTGVKYMIIKSNQSVDIIMLCNTDGTPQVYNGKKLE